MSSSQSMLPSLSTAYEDWVLGVPFKATSIELRIQTVISHGMIERQEKPEQIVVKTFREGGDITIETVARRTRREVEAWIAVTSLAIRCENINQFRGVLFVDSDYTVPGIPSIVTDYVKYNSLLYTQGTPFSERLNIVGINVLT
ncbi:hypothetical protein EST38_g9454 [Candolleomyces aberdarensis]|uniref:Uncharacterized protein n=1 Tax=Candolleomyces aberdarensis TaxID=2316362 RepID=A0A4Q2DCT6_9AGAR|nr:hypothetical protein EST38_g9454 [Candolleomyces aberdarensis]